MRRWALGDERKWRALTSHTQEWRKRARDQYLLYLYPVAFKACVVPWSVPIDVIDPVDQLYLWGGRGRKSTFYYSSQCNKSCGEEKISLEKMPLQKFLPITTPSIKMLFSITDTTNREITPGPKHTVASRINQQYTLLQVQVIKRGWNQMPSNRLFKNCHSSQLQKWKLTVDQFN